jgi:pilus assembly protein Flp/PilA
MRTPRKHLLITPSGSELSSIVHHRIHRASSGFTYVGQVATPKNASGKGSMILYIKRFIRNEAGATAIEYGLIAAGIAVAIIAVVQGLGTNLNTTFGTVQTSLK